MVILGIDPGTRCGWSVRADDGTHSSGVWDLRGSRFDGGGMRYLRFERIFKECLDIAKPTKVAFEEVRRHMGVDAAHVYGALIGIITKECEVRSIPYEGIPVSAPKTLATGKGNADKVAMLAAAIYKWPGWMPEDDNEADARWIAEVGFVGVPAPKKKPRKSSRISVDSPPTPMGDS